MSESKTYRVRMDRVSAVLHPESQSHVVPDPRQPYLGDDPLVRAYPWMFATDEEIVEQLAAGPIESAPIESATARPGQKSNARRRKGASDGETPEAPPSASPESE